MIVITLDEAEREFEQSVEHYESKQLGLGTRFRNEVAATVGWISGNPEIPRLRRKRYRRVNLRVFPHYIAYVIREDTIWIVAIAHGHQRPEFWLKRI